jgi:hypothetical protein
MYVCCKESAWLCLGYVVAGGRIQHGRMEGQQLLPGQGQVEQRTCLAVVLDRAIVPTPHAAHTGRVQSPVPVCPHEQHACITRLTPSSPARCPEGGSPNGSTGSKPASTPGSTTPRAAGHSHKRTGSGLNINLAALANLGNLQTNPSPAGSGRPGSSSGSILTTAAGSAAAATPSPGGRIPPSANAVAAAAPLLQRSGSGTVPAAPAPGHSRTNSAVSEKSSETTVSAGAAAASAAPSLATISSGPRSTLVVLPVAPDTYVPEWFFERTPADMKLEYQALVAKRQAGQVLSTRAYKEKQEAKGKTSYTSARVRVRFPEGVCIQVGLGQLPHAAGVPVTCLFSTPASPSKSLSCL